MLQLGWPQVLRLWVVLFLVPCAVGAQPAESETRRPPLTLYSPQKLIQMIQAGEPVVFVDVREPEEFAENHIPGAINIPQRDFSARKDEIPSDALVIPYCNMDFRGFVSARELEALGFRVGLMQERGILGWQAQGLPIVEPEAGATDAGKLAELAQISPESLQGDRFVPKVAPTGRRHEIAMEVSEWYFDPNDLQVQAGDEIRITLHSKKGDHYFIMPDYEIEKHLPEGETQQIVFVADRPGEYRFGSCEWDGMSLQVMKGRLRIVAPEADASPKLNQNN